jgi:hypothetical protein
MTETQDNQAKGKTMARQPVRLKLEPARRTQAEQEAGTKCYSVVQLANTTEWAIGQVLTDREVEDILDRGYSVDIRPRS